VDLPTSRLADRQSLQDVVVLVARREAFRDVLPRRIDSGVERDRLRDGGYLWIAIRVRRNNLFPEGFGEVLVLAQLASDRHGDCIRLLDGHCRRELLSDALIATDAE